MKIIIKKTIKSILSDGIRPTLLKGKNHIKNNILYRKKNTTRKVAVDAECYPKLKCHFNNLNKRIPTETPLVSILILNRNGLEHIQRLFTAINVHRDYDNFEIIIVDNASKDGSVEYIKSNPYGFSLNLIENKENVSFSKGNNQAAKVAKGEYLLLLNNDVEPTKGWLSELVYTMLNNKNIGSVGSKLIYPYKEKHTNSCTIQHAGIAFRYEGGFIRPYNIGTGKDPLENYNKDSSHVAVTAACLLISRERYNEVNGLDEAYFYGYEDVDLGLKLLSLGYENILCASSVLFHYEFGTQNKDSNEEKKNRRLNNMKIFQKKWSGFIKTRYWNEKLKSLKPFIAENKMTIALAVTEAGKNVSAGDFFTAVELGNELEKLGWHVIYLSRKSNEWYDIPSEVDVIVSLLDAYDVSKIDQSQKKVITIAWARNWFDRWVQNRSFNTYDFVFASSEIACNYINENSDQTAILMPIATNISKFDMSNRKPVLDYKCDYCFTGSYWGAEREIVTFINPSRLPDFKFHIYGKNWDKVEKLKAYDHGFLSYDQMPYVYANTKIVIDDANHVTKPYGSVNSRVFDALASGTLVLTNGVLGSKLTFDGKLPYFTTQDELYEHLSFYLSNEEARLNKVNELREIILQNHTYQHRANSVKELLVNFYQKPSIAIKIPAPNWKVVHEWGDYHFGLALKKEFEALGYRVLLQVLSEWDNDEGNECDIALVLRGLSRYTPKPNQINIMWNISHPDKVSIDEYNEYDHVFISSIIWAEHIASKTSVPVESLLQCSDTDLFKPLRNKDNEFRHELLFVGNSRKIYRKIIKDILPTKYSLSIYGNHWDGLVDKSIVKGVHIPNKELHKYYASADILLNDHWDDMREKGFISNRIFDALASGGFVISDQIEGIEDVLHDSIVTYTDKDDLRQKIDFYMSHPLEREKKAKQGLEIVSKNHTFKTRAKQLSKIMKNILKQKTSGSL